MNTKISRVGGPHRTAIKRIVSLILSFAMLFTVSAGIDFSAYAVITDNYWYSVQDDDTIKITQYTGKDSEFAVPASIDGYEVTVIGSFAFNRSSTLVSVTIPESLKTIGSYAFKECSNLTGIILPDSIENLYCGAFEKCISLKHITIPNSIKKIDIYMFRGCNDLTMVKLGINITSIGEQAFLGCDSLTDVYYNGTIEDWNKINIGTNNEPLLNAVIHCSDGAINCEHQIVTDEAVEPTCSTTGLTQGSHCSICGKIIVEQEIVPVIHNECEWIDDNGIIIKKCTVCNDELSRLPFTDLADTDYRQYGDYIEYTSVNNQFITGTNPPANTVFSPIRAIDRAMMVTIHTRMAGEPYANGKNPYQSTPFADITNTNAYYYAAACWALKNGITTETTFKPFDNVTREQTASFLFRYAKKNNMLGDEAYKNVNLADYPDFGGVHSWAVEPLQWANYNGMITGTQQGTADPQGATQRIHAAKILYGFGQLCHIGNFE